MLTYRQDGEKEGKIMLYDVEIKNWNERIPDDGIWDSDAFPEPFETATEEEAIHYAIDCYMEEDDWYPADCDPETVEIKDNCINYINHDGDKCAIVFRAKKLRGNQIRAWRKIRKMDQKVLAEYSDVTPQKLCLYEGMEDIGGVTVATLQKIARALNVTVDDLIAPD